MSLQHTDGSMSPTWPINWNEVDTPGLKDASELASVYVTLGPKPFGCPAARCHHAGKENRAKKSCKESLLECATYQRVNERKTSKVQFHLGHIMRKLQFTGKDNNARRHWWQERKWTTTNRLDGLNHHNNEHAFGKPESWDRSQAKPEN